MSFPSLCARDGDDALSDDELVGEANGLFVAGYDTSAQTLMWTLFLLALHGDVLDEVHAEFDAVLGAGSARRDPTAADVDRLVVLDRALKESMRVLPAAPMLFMREVVQETRLGDVPLPPGATVVLSTVVTHRDDGVFPEPRSFRPARFKDVDPPTYAYLPFGAGARMCLGAAFARQSLRLLLALILQRVRPVVVDGAVISRRVRGIALGTKGALPMRLLPRAVAAPRTRARVGGDIHDLVDLPR